jgi:hypothetical protein
VGFFQYRLLSAVYRESGLSGSIDYLSSHPISSYNNLSYATVKCSSPTASMSERNTSEESLLKNPKPQDSPPKMQEQHIEATTTIRSATILKPKQPEGSSVSAKGDFRKEWKVPQGYSSGASSYSGSDMSSLDGDAERRDSSGALNGHHSLEVSRHSDILDLSSLRQEMMAEGDLTKTVVRIEVRNSLRCFLLWFIPHKFKFLFRSHLSLSLSFIPPLCPIRLRLVNRLKKSTTESIMGKFWARAFRELSVSWYTEPRALSTPSRCST